MIVGSFFGSLRQWPTFKLLGITYSIGKNRPFKLVCPGPKIAFCELWSSGQWVKDSCNL